LAFKSSQLECVSQGADGIGEDVVKHEAEASSRG